MLLRKYSKRTPLGITDRRGEIFTNESRPSFNADRAAGIDPKKPIEVS